MTEFPTAVDMRELIRRALSSVVDAGTAGLDHLTLFTPDRHREALDPNVTLVRGARGVGKTAWFRALQDEGLRSLAADDYQLSRLGSVEAWPGYGERLQPDRYPGPSELNRMVDDGVEPYDIWSAVLLVALSDERLGQLGSWSERVAALRAEPERRDAALAQADAMAVDAGKTRLLLFDSLERLHPSRTYSDKLIQGILRLGLELRTRTRNIRAKIFIRPDMLNSRVLQFPDASKLTSNAADLQWSSTSLYGLFFHQLGNSQVDLASQFRETTGDWHQKQGRHTAPRELAGDRDSQQKLFVRIAGPWMGANHRKGHTYTWLPGHLADGIGQVSPRSFLSALRRANEFTSSERAKFEFALHWDGIRGGVQVASKNRVDEISEDLPWVKLAIEPLNGLQVPIDREVVLRRWEEYGLRKKLEDDVPVVDQAQQKARPTGPRSLEYPSLLEELQDVGVITHRASGKLDLPDVYRIAFGLGRRGGVPLRVQ